MSRNLAYLCLFMLLGLAIGRQVVAGASVHLDTTVLAGHARADVALAVDVLEDHRLRAGLECVADLGVELPVVHARRVDPRDIAVADDLRPHLPVTLDRF
jgi:predicted butyrate kinase (DUF1464 family)